MAVKTGVIGFGLAGRVFHAPFISAVPDLQLTAIVQRKGEDAAKAYPNATIFRSVEDLVKSDVELVVVGTPNATHVPFAKMALAAGKHVVIDKPFTPTSEDALELEQMAKSSGRLLFPFHNRRYDGDFQTLRKIVVMEKAGRPVVLRSRFDRFRPKPRTNTWKESTGAENGLLMDLGPHLVDQALVLFGRPESIAASVRTERDGSGIEDAFDLTLTFLRSGHQVRAELGASMLAAAANLRYLLQGTAGSYRKLGLDPQEPTILAGTRVPALHEDTEWLREDSSAWGTLTTAPDPETPSQLQSETVPTLRGDYREFYRAVADSIQHGAPAPVTSRDGFRVARLLEMARESSRTGSTLPVTDQDW